MIAAATLVSLGFLGLAVLGCLVRLALGPSPIDRVMALDTLTLVAIAAVLVAGIAWASDVYGEAALLLAMGGFVATVAFAKSLMRGDVIE